MQVQIIFLSLQCCMLLQLFCFAKLCCRLLQTQMSNFTGGLLLLTVDSFTNTSLLLHVSNHNNVIGQSASDTVTFYSLESH